jgi:hypothetical protein
LDNLDNKTIPVINKNNENNENNFSYSDKNPSSIYPTGLENSIFLPPRPEEESENMQHFEIEPENTNKSWFQKFFGKGGKTKRKQKKGKRTRKQKRTKRKKNKRKTRRNKTFRSPVF